MLAATPFAATSAQAARTKTLSAEAFVESVGINTHISSEPYAGRFEEVRGHFRTLGIRYFRDELRPTNDISRWRTLFEADNVRANVLVSPHTNTIAEMMEYLEKLGIDAVSAVEGQNEGNSPWFLSQPVAGPDWAKTVVAYQREVYEALRERWDRDTLPIVSPTVINWKPDDMKRLAGAAKYADITAIHSYVQEAQEPETKDNYAGVGWYKARIANRFASGKPIMVTEIGYNTSPNLPEDAVSELAQGIYLPRMLLNNFAEGIERTFIYELLDSGNVAQEWEHNWGLVRFNGTKKPAYDAVAALLTVLAGRDAAAAPQAPAPVDVSIKNAPKTTRLMPFRREDGSTVAAVWRAESCWEPQLRVDLDLAPQPVVLATGGAIAEAAAWTLGADAGWRSLTTNGGSVELPVGAAVTLVRIIPA
jgi:hypothetical protein